MAIPIRNLLPLLGFNAQGDLAGITIYQSQRGARVYYPKAPPLNPASTAQLAVRNRFRLAAYLWRWQTAAQRAAWLTAAKAAGLRITGYNLWIYWQMTKDEPTIRTVERLANATLLH